MSLLARAEMAESKLAYLREQLKEMYLPYGEEHKRRELINVIDAEVWDGYQFIEKEGPCPSGTS